MGRQGIPLPEEKPTADAIWQAVADARAKMEAENLYVEPVVEKRL